MDNLSGAGLEKWVSKVGWARGGEGATPNLYIYNTGKYYKHYVIILIVEKRQGVVQVLKL